MYSLSQGKLAIPTLWDAKKASIQGNQLVESKPKLQALYQHIQAKQTNL